MVVTSAAFAERMALIRTALLAALTCALALAAACNGDSDAGDGGAAAVTPVLTVTPLAAGAATKRAAALCAANPDVQTAIVDPPEIVEASGIVASRKNPGVIWTHNDSGDAPRLIAISTDGKSRGVWDVHAEALDWEDIALGPGPRPGEDYLYIGDIGDNTASRLRIVIYRVSEPEVEDSSGGTLDRVERIPLHFPDGARDAETLIVDPQTGDLYILARKEPDSLRIGVYRAPVSMLHADGGELERIAEIPRATLVPDHPLPAGLSALAEELAYVPTGGDISSDGLVIAIRTYANIWVWARESGTTLGEAFMTAPCEARSVPEPQGEAIAFSSDGGGYFTLSEGANPVLHHFRMD